MEKVPTRQYSVPEFVSDQRDRTDIQLMINSADIKSRGTFRQDASIQVAIPLSHYVEQRADEEGKRYYELVITFGPYQVIYIGDIMRNIDNRLRERQKDSILVENQTSKRMELHILFWPFETLPATIAIEGQRTPKRPRSEN
jgi:hypothetical protein